MWRDRDRNLAVKRRYPRYIRGNKSPTGASHESKAERRQEKARVPRTVRKAFGHDGGTIPWINYSSTNVNFYYFYCLDEEFGPFFIKFCSYFPYTAKLCINGHEYLKRQLERRAIAYQALDNGIWWTEQLRAAQRICDRFDQQKIDAFFHKGLRRLPHPLPQGQAERH